MHLPELIDRSSLSLQVVTGATGATGVTGVTGATGVTGVTGVAGGLVQSPSILTI